MKKRAIRKYRIIFMRRFTFFLLLLIIIAIPFTVLTLSESKSSQSNAVFWNFKSIDTMKFSRDKSREKLKDPSFDVIINNQLKDIAKTGATHVAIGTPYDEEFIPILTRWVEAARRNKLKIWFRGNFSGWEGWFGYPKIDRQTHLTNTEEFILKNSSLFEDGDVFSACPECENGGPGDPRRIGDVSLHRQFLVNEYDVTKKAFQKIGKQVDSNFNSMNGDVAQLVMDKTTTKKLGGIVVVDHYVKTPEQLSNDIDALAAQSGGKIILGEFGAPIPDIHGIMTEEQQAEWIKQAFVELSTNKNVIGMNYWTNIEGSTEIWTTKRYAKEAVAVVTHAYEPHKISGTIQNEIGRSVPYALITSQEKEIVTDQKGTFTLPYYNDTQKVTITAEGYFKMEVSLSQVQNSKTVVLKKENEDFIFKIFKFQKFLTTPHFN